MASLLFQLCLAACLIFANHAMTTEPVATEEMPVAAIETTTAFVQPTECDLGNIRRDTENNRFQSKSADINGTENWIVTPCQEVYLVFNMTVCACVEPEFDCDYIGGEADEIYTLRLPPRTKFNCTNGMAWNQTGCRCDWRPGGPRSVPIPEVTQCETMLQTSFDDMVGVTIPSTDSATTQQLDGAVGNSLSITKRGGMGLLNRVNYAWFGPGFTIEFRFRSTSDTNFNDRYVALVTNGCWSKQTISIAYRAMDLKYLVFVAGVSRMDGSNVDINLECNDVSRAVVDGFQWNDVQLFFRPAFVSLFVNGVQCSRREIANVRPAVPKCALALGGDRATGGSRRPGLLGGIDEVTIRRNCF